MDKQITQSNLFGEPLTTGGRNYSEQRQRAIKKAQEAQSEAFQIEYRNFVLKYAETHETLTNEAVRRAYDKTNLPKPISLKSGKIEYRAAGGLIQSLVREGKLVCIGTTISPTRKSDIKVFKRGK